MNPKRNENEMNFLRIEIRIVLVSQFETLAEIIFNVNALRYIHLMVATLVLNASVFENI